ncbi:MAG: long-chain fatty acid--CoA ligase [Terrimicrobiaceae bacterium]
MKNLDDPITQSNPFLDRWNKISSDLAGEPAILSQTGTPLLSFAELDQAACLWALQIQNLRLTRPVVAIKVGNSPDWPAIFLGIWKAGGVAVPEGPYLPSGLNPHAKVVPDPNGVPALVPVHEMEIDIHPAVDLVKLTSGTVSGVQAVGFSAAQLLADAANICAGMEIRRPDRNVGVVPLSHSYGLSNLMGLLVAEGVPLILSDPLPRSILEALNAGGGTVLPVVPTLIRTLAAVGGSPGSLRLCLSAGALLPSRDAKMFHQVFGKKVHTFYGASECGGICFDSLEDPDVPEGYIGTPLPGVKVCPEAVDAGLRIRVESGAVALGHIPPGTETTLRPGSFLTSDLLESSGNGYRMLGREGDSINVGGRKVHPLQIESVLRLIDGVEDCVVFGISDDSSRGEQIAACLVGPASPDEVRAACAGHLPTWQTPRRWFALDTLPVDERGKVSRRRLKELLLGS